MLKDELYFEWNELKEIQNWLKHGVSFEEAQSAFLDSKCIFAEDPNHSYLEKRFYCYGLDQAKKEVLTVRFTMREDRVRIIGAGYWRKGRIIYGEKNGEGKK